MLVDEGGAHINKIETQFKKYFAITVFKLKKKQLQMNPFLSVCFKNFCYSQKIYYYVGCLSVATCLLYPDSLYVTCQFNF